MSLIIKKYKRTNFIYMRCTWFNVLLCCWHSPKPELKRTNITERVRVGRTLTSVIKTLKTTWTITGNFRGHKCWDKVCRLQVSSYNLSLTHLLSFLFVFFLFYSTSLLRFCFLVFLHNLKLLIDFFYFYICVLLLYIRKYYWIIFFVDIR